MLRLRRRRCSGKRIVGRPTCGRRRLPQPHRKFMTAFRAAEQSGVAMRRVDGQLGLTSGTRHPGSHATSPFVVPGTRPSPGGLPVYQHRRFDAGLKANWPQAASSLAAAAVAARRSCRETCFILVRAAARALPYCRGRPLPQGLVEQHRGRRRDVQTVGGSQHRQFDADDVVASPDGG
jgi:hypothetical protein